MIPESDIEKALNFIRDNAGLIGQLMGNKEYLEHRMKVEKAQIFLAHDGTGAVRDAIAQSDPGVIKLIEAHKDVVTELNTLRTQYKAAELKIEVWRSQNANQRKGHL